MHASVHWQTSTRNGSLNQCYLYKKIISKSNATNDFVKTLEQQYRANAIFV